MSPADRRRLTLATVITLVALPALWLMQRDDTAPGSPGLAAAGAPSLAADTDDSVDTEPPAPAYLEGPASSVDEAPDSSLVIATSADDVTNRLTGTAGFRRFDPALFAPGSCSVHGAPLGVRVTVRNVDNDRTIDCLNMSTTRGDDGEVAVLDRASFLQIADLVDAPLPVEITW